MMVAGVDLERRVTLAVARCAQSGVQFTQLRRQVLEIILAANGPITAYEILSRLQFIRRGAAPPTVYRSLEILLEVGLVHRLDSTRTFVACEHPNHPHSAQFLICRKCGTVVEADDEDVVRATKGLGERYGFRIDDRTVELAGICGGCQYSGPDGAAR